MSVGALMIMYLACFYFIVLMSEKKLINTIA